MADHRAFPWAAELSGPRLAAFIDDLWGAASGAGDRSTLAAVERVIARHGHEYLAPECPLTVRELEVLTLLASGASYTSAGRALGTSQETVRRQASTIYVKLGVRDKAHAAAVAAHHGWLTALKLPQMGPSNRQLGAAHWAAVHAKAAADMRAAPVTEIPIGPYGSFQAAHRAVRDIAHGLSAPYRPGGAFTARSERGEFGWTVLGQYVGTNDDQEGTAEV